MEAPTPPDPYATAKAQGQMNKETAVAQTGLNAMDQYTPDGNLNYSQNGTWEDGTPRFSVKQTLSDDNQKIYDLGQQTKQNIGKIGVDQTARIGSLLSTPFTINAGAMPTGPDAGKFFTDPTAPQARYAPDAIMVDRQSIGSNDQLTDQLYAAGMSRMAPQLAERRGDAESLLANKGLTVGSTGYERGMRDITNGENDARTNLFLHGQGQAFDQAATRANTTFGQDLSRTGQFWTQGAAKAQQDYAQDLAGKQFQMAANGQNFGMSQQDYADAMQGRQQGIDEQLAQRNQPLNEISALLSGSQISAPKWTATPQSTIQPVDYTGLVENNYKSQMQGYSGMLSGIGSIFGSAMKMLPFSDRRLKTDIKRVGTLENGLGVYSYRMKSGGPIIIGVMADEVEQIHPEAVHVMPNGFKAVDYALATEAA
jgi:hypothetical protein